MRQEVIELGRLGPLPPSDVVVRENLDSLIDKYGQLLMSIEKPVTDEEARVLVKLLGPDDGFGLVWPLADCLENIDNEWIRLLRQRVRNASSD